MTTKTTKNDSPKPIADGLRSLNLGRTFYRRMIAALMADIDEQYSTHKRLIHPEAIQESAANIRSAEELLKELRKDYE